MQFLSCNTHGFRLVKHRDDFNMSCLSFSALVKLLNKSIEGTADDDEEGVTPDTAIRSGLELLKVCNMQASCNKCPK